MEKETAKCDSDFKEMAAAVKCKEEDKTVDRLRSLKTCPTAKEAAPAVGTWPKLRCAWTIGEDTACWTAMPGLIRRSLSCDGVLNHYFYMILSN